MKDHELVTGVAPAASRRVTLTCQSVSEPDAKPAPAGRLEDVEKFVRNHEARLSELEVWCLDIIDRLMTRLEMLESGHGFEYGEDRNVGLWWAQ